MAAHDGCVLHLDLDCFYVQVEMLRRNLPAERPVAVTQKFLVVTCNYAARAAGVAKLMATQAAQERCPDLLLVSGEDLTPYREASEACFEELCAVGAVQRLGLDEFFIDVRAEAERLLAAQPQWEAHTHVHRAALGTTTAEALAGVGSNHRPMDLRAATAPSGSTKPQGGAAALAAAAPSSDESTLLHAGSHVAASVRRAIRLRTGLTCSVGIASSKLLAKLVSGLHKPDGQTALPESEAVGFVGPLSVRVLPGVGGTAEKKLHALGARTVAQLASLPLARLAEAVGAAAAARLASVARTGTDPEPVAPSGPPKTVSVEDSFKGATSLEQVGLVLRVLAPDLQRRLLLDRQRHHRAPRSLLVRWRHAGSRTMHVPHGATTSHTISCTAPMPPRAHAGAGGVEALQAAAAAVLRAQLHGRSFCLTLLAIGAAGFTALGGGRGGGDDGAGDDVEDGGDDEGGGGGGENVRALSDACRAPPGSEHATEAARAAADRSPGSAAASSHRDFRAHYSGRGSDGVGASPQLMSKSEERRRQEGGADAHGAPSHSPVRSEGGRDSIRKYLSVASAAHAPLSTPLVAAPAPPAATAARLSRAEAQGSIHRFLVPLSDEQASKRARTDGEAAAAWACQQCTFLHETRENVQYLACMMCGQPRGQ